MLPNDETVDGKPIYCLSIKELPGCMAQGETLWEVKRNLVDVMDDYLLSLVEDGMLSSQGAARVEVVT